MLPAHKAPVDPAVLSSIRWLLCRLEMLAIQAYWCDRGNFAQIKAAIGAACAALEPQAHERVAPPAPADDPCPWDRCADGSCAPVCGIGD